MFGMLDYRAHKLYIILFFIPNLALILFAMFGLPFINYSIGLIFADERIYQILTSLISIFFVEMIWLFFIYGFVSKTFQFIFELFVDVIPHDGRTKEEAQMVVWSGDKAIRTLNIAQHPTMWEESLLYEMPKNDWVNNLFFRDEIVHRLHVVHDYYLDAPDTPFTDDEVDRILVERNIKPSWQENVFGNPQIRRASIGYSFFLLLLLLHPFG